MTLKLRGVGYQSEENKPKEKNFYEDLPKARAHLNPEDELKAAFSIEEIDFGEVAPSLSAKRMVTLYNLSQDQKLRFEFEKTGLLCTDNINLMPISGELEPGTHKNIKMVLKAAQLPTHFEGEIQCEIEWEDTSGDPVNMTHQSHTNTRSMMT